MTDRWPIHHVNPDLRLRITRGLPPLPQALDAEVSRLWDATQIRMAGRLFNGRVFSADRIAPDVIEGHWTEFRRIVARMDRPDLMADQPVRPLAAGGVISGGTGEHSFVVFGRRPAGAVYQAGEWQLPPAGSIDSGAAVPGSDAVDWLGQLHTELEEELGLPASTVHSPRALCIVEHPGSGVLDLGIAVHTGLSPAQIHAAHAAGGNGEYDPLELVPVAGLPAFLARHAGHVTRQAPVFLRHAGLLPG